jgi:ribonuclease-3
MDDGFPPHLLLDLEHWRTHWGVTIDEALLLEAFTHPSYKGLVPGVRDYERLEFVGDALLDLLVADALYHQGEAPEGQMTEARQHIISNDALARVFDRLGLGPFVRTALQYHFSVKDKANVVEALFAAFFLAVGRSYAQTRQFFDRVFQPEDITPTTPAAEQPPDDRGYHSYYEGLGITPKNAISTLQELAQKLGYAVPDYSLVDRTGPDHQPVFRVQCTFPGVPELGIGPVVGEGEGSNQKIARAEAAADVCRQIGLRFVPQ